MLHAPCTPLPPSSVAPLHATATQQCGPPHATATQQCGPTHATATQQCGPPHATATQQCGWASRRVGLEAAGTEHTLFVCWQAWEEVWQAGGDIKCPDVSQQRGAISPPSPLPPPSLPNCLPTSHSYSHHQRGGQPSALPFCPHPPCLIAHLLATATAAPHAEECTCYSHSYSCRSTCSRVYSLQPQLQPPLHMQQRELATATYTAAAPHAAAELATATATAAAPHAAACTRYSHSYSRRSTCSRVYSLQPELQPPLHMQQRELATACALWVVLFGHNGVAKVGHVREQQGYLGDAEVHSVPPAA